MVMISSFYNRIRTALFFFAVFFALNTVTAVVSGTVQAQNSPAIQMNTNSVGGLQPKSINNQLVNNSDVSPIMDSGLTIPETTQRQQFPKMNFGQDNKYFTNITTLQYQNSLLESLVERQGKAKEIATSFKEIGLPFRQPAPPRSVCAELPKNDLCNSFYSDLYANRIAPRLNAVRENNDLMDERVTPIDAPVIQRKKVTKKKTIIEDVPYRWADISCVAGQCRAVLVGHGAESQAGRTTVTVGTIMKDGWQVDSIGFNQITMRRDARLETLNPLPIGASKSPFFAGINQDANTFNNNGSNDIKTSSMDDFQTEIDVEELLSELEQDPSLGLDEEIEIIQ